MHRIINLLLLVVIYLISYQAKAVFIKGNDPRIQYVGRIEYKDDMPRLWTAGAYFRFAFAGDTCKIYLADQVHYGVMHNYIEIQVDDETPVRLKLQSYIDTLLVIPQVKKQRHEVIVCKNTETGIGFVEVQGLEAGSFLAPPLLKKKLFEFFGDSITSAASSDSSLVGCGKGRWEDQHNAYMGYGARTARMCEAEWALSSVSGIGLMHSCCNMKVTLPQVWEKIDLVEDSITWDFKSYSPDIVFICLGQNDGIQDTLLFQENYKKFIRSIRARYIKAPVILLTSPMADDYLAGYMRYQLKEIIRNMKQEGEKSIDSYFFKKRYYHGCDIHPSVSEHGAIAAELTAFLKKQGYIK